MVVLGLGVPIPADAAGRAHGRCGVEHWLASWAASPSDATPDPDPSDPLEVAAASSDVSGNPKTPIVDETERMVITPHWGGSTLRLHLSNRFGEAPVTFDHVAVARRLSGASVLPGSSVAVTFDGLPATTIAPGDEVVSDRVPFSFEAFERLSVSIHLPGSQGMPTEHYTARQTSYRTAAGSGDHVADASGTSFVRHTTSWYYLIGLDVRARRGISGVVAFGDSITDGYQGQSPGVPETAEGIDADGRWPDVLQRRVLEEGRSLSILNAGISGNRILQNGAEGAGIPQYGPSALHRLQRDAIGLAGVKQAIVLEGINDLGSDPGAPVIAGLRRLVHDLHIARLRVMVGTLTPAGRSGDGEAARVAVNKWIRTSGVPDAVVDFDAAVRDPANPSQIAPAYDGSDHLHFNLAGYRAMADAVPLAALRHKACRRPKLRLRVMPHRVRPGRRVRLRFTTRARKGGLMVRVPNIRVVVAGRVARSNRRGRGTIRVRFTDPGRVHARATAPGYRAGRARVHVRRWVGQPPGTDSPP